MTVIYVNGIESNRWALTANAMVLSEAIDSEIITYHNPCKLDQEIERSTMTAGAGLSGFIMSKPTTSITIITKGQGFEVVQKAIASLNANRRRNKVVLPPITVYSFNATSKQFNSPIAKINNISKELEPNKSFWSNFQPELAQIALHVAKDLPL